MVEANDVRQLTQIADWHADLAALHARIARRFRRREVRDRAGRYLTALLGPVERRTGWQVAEHLGERSPDGVQRLLRTAHWDADAARDDLRAYVVEHLGDAGAVLVIDETGFLKKGAKSAGVARQYSGTAGRLENCQIGVFLAYASATGHAFLDRALYLPKAWIDDPARCRAAGIPTDVTFATKPTLAQAMLERAFAAEVPAAWVVGDTVYGNDSKLRFWLQEQPRSYVLEVTSNHMVWQGFEQRRVDALAAEVPDDGWERLTVALGSKGPRIYDWALARLPYESEPGFAQWLLLRRSVSEPNELAYYRVFGPAATTRQAMAQVAGMRWVIEASFERAKGEVGLDQYEVRTWTAWYRHVTLSLLAYAFLEVTRTAAGMDGKKGGAGPDSADGAGGAAVAAPGHAAGRRARLSPPLVPLAPPTPGAGPAQSLSATDATSMNCRCSTSSPREAGVLMGWEAGRVGSAPFGTKGTRYAFANACVCGWPIPFRLYEKNPEIRVDQAQTPISNQPERGYAPKVPPARQDRSAKERGTGEEAKHYFDEQGKNQTLIDFGWWLLRQVDEKYGNQAGFAQATGVSTATVSRWVNGRTMPTPEHAQKIARALGLSLNEVRSKLGQEKTLSERVDPQLLSLLEFFRSRSNRTTSGQGDALGSSKDRGRAAERPFCPATRQPLFLFVRRC